MAIAINIKKMPPGWQPTPPGPQYEYFTITDVYLGIESLTAPFVPGMTWAEWIETFGDQYPVHDYDGTVGSLFVAGDDYPSFKGLVVTPGTCCCIDQMGYGVPFQKGTDIIDNTKQYIWGD